VLDRPVHRAATAGAGCFPATITFTQLPLANLVGDVEQRVAVGREIDRITSAFLFTT
jgi:hypothetical protein